MGNVYLGSELLNGGGSSSSGQAGASAISSLSIWSGTYQEYQAISTPDTSTIYFVKGRPSSYNPSGTTFTKTQSHSGSHPQGVTVTFTVDTVSIIDPDLQPGDAVQFKWWMTDATVDAAPGNFTVPTNGTGIGTSLATASFIENSSITLDGSLGGLYRVNVAAFHDGNQIGDTQTFSDVTINVYVTLSITSSYSGASFFWQCGGPSASGSVVANSGSIRVGGEVDPDQSVSQSASITSGDATYATEICYGFSDGFGFRMYAGNQNSTMSCSFSASERSLKKDIKFIGVSNSGLNIYTFKYINEKFGKGTFQGVMADEMSTDVVAIHPDGYRVVNYSAIDVDFKQIKK